MCRTNTDEHVTPKKNFFAHNMYQSGLKHGRCLYMGRPCSRWLKGQTHVWACTQIVLWSAHTIFVLQVDAWAPTQSIKCIHSSHVLHTPWREQRLKKHSFWHIWWFFFNRWRVSTYTGGFYSNWWRDHFVQHAHALRGGSILRTNLYNNTKCNSFNSIV